MTVIYSTGVRGPQMSLIESLDCRISVSPKPSMLPIMLGGRLVMERDDWWICQGGTYFRSDRRWETLLLSISEHLQLFSS